MKKVLIISFLIFTILFSLFGTSYAAVTVTKENLKESFDKFVSSEANEDNYTVSVEDAVINLTEGTNTYKLNYNLTDKPSFSFEVEIKKGISYEDFKIKEDILSLPMYGYIAVANIQGVSLKDSATYFMFSYLGSALGSASVENPYMIVDDLNLSEGVTIAKTDAPKTIYTSEFGDRVMEYVNVSYPKTLTISDSKEANSYVMTIEKKDVTENSCKLVSTLTVDADADFSKLNGYADNTFGQIGNTMQNMVNGIQQATNNAQLSLNNLITQQESVNKLTNSITKLPQTGDSFGLKNGLYLLCITSSIVLIFIIFKSVNYRNIEK